MRCGKEVRLPGGYRYRAVRVRTTRTCFRCRKPIPALSEAVVEEKFMVGRRYYHPECFEEEFRYRFSVRKGPSGLEVCETLKEDSAF